MENFINQTLSTKAFNIISDILANNITKSHIVYSYNKNYSIVSLGNSIFWICRLNLSATEKQIIFPLNDYCGEKQISLTSIQDIRKQSALIIESYNNALTYIN